MPCLQLNLCAMASEIYGFANFSLLQAMQRKFFF